MATFDLGKEQDDLQEPVLMPEDWYTLVISQKVVKKKNKAWKDGGEKLAAADIKGAGENLIIQGRIVSDEPEYNGRVFFKYLALPNPSDEGKYMNDGQPKKDWKLDQIYKWVEAFGGSIEGSTVGLNVKMKAQVYIEETEDNRSGDTINAIGFTLPKPISEAPEEFLA